VDSQAVLLELKEADQTRPACFYPLVRQLFSSRRKTIKNNLTGFFGSNVQIDRGKAAEMATQALEKSGFDGGRRAENLSLDDFLALAKTLEDMGI
jgi:16S rRNA (adenine1518-N6/adenine1519-N6)-dimethyltransferase